MHRLIAVVAMAVALPALAATPASQNVVIPLGAAPQLILPAAGSVAGGNGTFFRSDITIINFANRAQQVELRWVPRVGDTASVRTITIAALSGIGSEDFVTTVLGEQGLGSIIVTGLTDTGAPDTTARLFASDRIWTNEPGSIGTTSQSFNVVPPSTSAVSQQAIFGIHRDSHYRANVGIVNLDASTQTFVITVATSSATPVQESYTVTLPPMTMQQVSLLSGTAPLTQVNVVRSGGASSSWLTYGSSVDNTTGDSWSELGIPAAP